MDGRQPDPATRLAWAGQRIEELKAALAAFDRGNPDSFSEELDPATAELVYRVRTLPSPPPELALRLGEILYSLRAALDAAVWALRPCG
ncbi:MAG: hypothetical protein ACRDGL_11555 [Candidatus Limnocylindrales bacterium]